MIIFTSHRDDSKVTSTPESTNSSKDISRIVMKRLLSPRLYIEKLPEKCQEIMSSVLHYSQFWSDLHLLHI